MAKVRVGASVWTNDMAYDRANVMAKGRARALTFVLPSDHLFSNLESCASNRFSKCPQQDYLLPRVWCLYNPFPMPTFSIPQPFLSRASAKARARASAMD